MNLSGRKTCQGLRVPSLVFTVGWFLVSLAQSVARASQLKLSNLLLVCSFGFFGLKTYFVAEGLYFVVVETLADT
ncbi:hypothetical protein EEA47_03050 [Vibrio alginolyticus]|nr:hypothetical protein EEA47_03050 [Vibrio alginolyticus]